MVTESRSVPVVRLKVVSTGFRTQLWAQQMTAQDLIAKPPQESIVIPLDWTRTSETLAIQYCVRLSTIELFHSAIGPRLVGYPGVVIFVLFRDESGRLIVLESGPQSLSFVNTGGSSAWADGIYWATRDQGLDMTVFVAPGYTSALRGDTTITSFNVPVDASVTAKIEAIIVSADEEYAVANSEFMVGEIRVWEGRGFADLESLKALRGMRLDGREPGLIGYWKLSEGQGTRIEDSSRYGHHGTLMGGSWVSATDSGLTLDCAREVGRENIRRGREGIGQQLNTNRLLTEEVERLTQEKQRLNTHIEQLKANRTALDDRFKQDLQARDAALQKLEGDYRAWQDDIEDGGKVAVSAFSNTIAQEIDRATQRLNTAQSPYSLQSVALEVKALPVAGQDDTGMRLRFPSMDDQKIQSDQLSTLRMSFAARPSEPVRARAAVPDVRGCTEAPARRQLGVAGFRVEVLDQAARSEAEIGRVVSQVPSHDVLAEPDKVVRVFIGRASGAGAPAGTGGTGEGA